LTTARATVLFTVPTDTPSTDRELFARDRRVARELLAVRGVPGMLTGRRVEVVFAVYLKPLRPQARAGLFDSSAASRMLPAIPPPKILWFSRRL
jgi:molybdopterin-guanine dinucleotide biosynthesis protein A